MCHFPQDLQEVKTEKTSFNALLLDVMVWGISLATMPPTGVCQAVPEPTSRKAGLKMALSQNHSGNYYALTNKSNNCWQPQACRHPTQLHQY
jgi:hypothetical protein